MNYKYTAKPLFYVLVMSMVLAVFIPILIPVVIGVWFFVALINFGNRALKG